MKTKRFLSIVLILAMLVGMFPGMSLTAYAAGTTTTITPSTDDAKTGTGTMTITLKIKAAQTITASDVTATYGDTDKSVSGTTTGDGAISYSVKSGDAVTVDENTGALTIVKSGSAVITVTAAETATYAQATKDVNVTVNTKAMTVSAENVNVTVDGQPHGITVNVTDPASGATVKYGTEVGTYNLDASPTQTEAGELTVYYQVTADNYTTYTGNAKVTVNAKQTQTITASDVTATYGDTDKKVEATTDGNGAISYAVKDGSADYIDVDASTGALTIKKVGTATVIVTAAETSTYTQATKEVTVTINKANAVAATVTANNRTYDGTEKTLVNVTGEATGGTMQYALGTKDAATQPYTTSIPTATDVGTYYVWYKVTGDDNHSNTTAANVPVTINKATVTAPTIASKTYTGQTQTADVAESTLYSVTTNNGGTNVGSYDVVLTLTDSANYKWSDSTAAAKTLSFQITKAAANTVTVNIEGWTYGEAAKAPTSTATFGTAAYTYAIKGSTQFAAEVPTNAGEYTVKAAVAGTDNYPAGEATTDFTIARASITPTVNITGWTIGETANTPSVTGNTGDGAVTYTYAVKGDTTFSAEVPTTAGEYTVKASIAATANYNGAEATADFTIAKKTPVEGVDFTVEALQLTYTGVRKELVRQTILTDGLEIEYSFDNGASIETGLPMKKASGEYLISYRVIGNDIYETLDWTGPVTATITMYATFRSPDFVLPAFLTEIGEEAFAEDTSLTIMDASNCAKIDANAFRGCTNLKRIRLAQNCEIDDTAFEDCVALRAVFAPSGGTTAAWCASHDVNFVVDPQA